MSRIFLFALAIVITVASASLVMCAVQGWWAKWGLPQRILMSYVLLLCLTALGIIVMLLRSRARRKTAPRNRVKQLTHE